MPKQRADALESFIVGLAAATELLDRVRKNGLIETIVLAAAVIDGSLRIGLFLRHQIESKSDDLLGNQPLVLIAAAACLEDAFPPPGGLGHNAGREFPSALSLQFLTWRGRGYRRSIPSQSFECS
jgi:hypothetical protein